MKNVMKNTRTYTVLTHSQREQFKEAIAMFYHDLGYTQTELASVFPYSGKQVSNFVRGFDSSVAAIGTRVRRNNKRCM